MPPAVDDLRTVPLWRGFSDAELSEIAVLFRPVADPAQLFRVGDPGASIYLVTAGEVLLDRPGDDSYRLRPPALIGELGALTSLARTSSATAAPGSVVWEVDAKILQGFLAENQELGVRFLINLLDLVADKVQRDQTRMAEMRGAVIRTQHQLKGLRELILESTETPLSAPIHDAIDGLISNNRRVNYRVAPPAALSAALRVDVGRVPVVEISRTHTTVTWRGAPPATGTWISGVADLAGTDLPVSGKVLRVVGGLVTIEFDLLIDEYAEIFEGYLTRVQLLDVLV